MSIKPDYRKGKSNEEKEEHRIRKRSNKLRSLKNELEGGRLTGFDQMFAIMTETAFSEEMNMSFYTLRKRVYYPGQFTLDEINRLADVIGVEYEIVHSFINMQRLAKNRG